MANNSAPRQFLDTNILIYAVGLDPRSSVWTAAALELMKLPNLVISTQVLAEFYVQATRPTRPKHLTHKEANNLVLYWSEFTVVDITRTVFFDALQIKERYGVSFWDAQIIAASKSVGCTTILSQDMNHGQDYGGVVVSNPFV